MILRFRHATGIAALAAVTALACSAPAVTDVTSREASARELLGSVNLVECPANTSTSSTSIVGPLGGVVSAGGTSISIPAGALLSPVSVTVTVPESNLMEIDVSVSGSEHFVFEQPVVITLSYARCNRNLSFTPLSVWHIDSETDEPLEFMGGVDNKLLRTITFVTPHLSGYAIAE